MMASFLLFFFFFFFLYKVPSFDCCPGKTQHIKHFNDLSDLMYVAFVTINYGNRINPQSTLILSKDNMGQIYFVILRFLLILISAYRLVPHRLIALFYTKHLVTNPQDFLKIIISINIDLRKEMEMQFYSLYIIFDDLKKKIIFCGKMKCRSLKDANFTLLWITAHGSEIIAECIITFKTFCNKKKSFMLNRPKMKYWRTNEICDLKKKNHEI